VRCAGITIRSIPSGTVAVPNITHLYCQLTLVMIGERLKMITTMDWIKSISVPDWWFLGLSEKDRLRIEKERGIDWNDLREK